jgi:hypothetical protein
VSFLIFETELKKYQLINWFLFRNDFLFEAKDLIKIVSFIHNLCANTAG